jgi:predicted ATPase
MNRLVRDYPALGYDVAVIPPLSVAEHADFVLGPLASGQSSS